MEPHFGPDGSRARGEKLLKDGCTVVLAIQNEGPRIQQALESAALLGDYIIVVDGGSTDETLQVVRAFNCKPVDVCENPYRNSAEQKNLGLSRVETRWTFFLDADEKPSDDCVADVREIVMNQNSDFIYDVARRNLFCGKWMKHGGWWPDFNARLIVTGKAQYEDRVVHEHIQTELPRKRLRGWLEHDTSPSLNKHVMKMLQWSDLQAQVDHIQDIDRVSAKDVSLKMRVRGLANLLPFRPFSRFVYMYILAGGFKDGRRGYQLAVLSAFSEFMTREKRRDCGLRR